jgi:hypothetical protein
MSLRSVKLRSNQDDSSGNGSKSPVEGCRTVASGFRHGVTSRMLREKP